MKKRMIDSPYPMKYRGYWIHRNPLQDGVWWVTYAQKDNICWATSEDDAKKKIDQLLD